MCPVDLAAEGLAYARRSGIARLAQAYIARLPFRAESFDVVVSLDGLPHFPRGGERRALEEFARALRPGGLAILRVSALDVLRSRHSEFTQNWFSTKLFESAPEGPHPRFPELTFSCCR